MLLQKSLPKTCRHAQYANPQQPQQQILPVRSCVSDHSSDELRADLHSEQIRQIAGHRKLENYLQTVSKCKMMLKFLQRSYLLTAGNPLFIWVKTTQSHFEAPDARHCTEFILRKDKRYPPNTCDLMQDGLSPEVWPPIMRCSWQY